jgi:hypothetical protein
MYTSLGLAGGHVLRNINTPKSNAADWSGAEPDHDWTEGWTRCPSIKPLLVAGNYGQAEIIEFFKTKVTTLNCHPAACAL